MLLLLRLEKFASLRWREFFWKIKKWSRKYTELTLSGRDGKGAAYAHIAYQENLKGLWKVPVSVVHRNGITRYRAELPLAKLGILNRSGTLFRFAFLINENDGKGRIRWMEWMGGIGRAKNPDEFGWGVLR